MPIEMPRGLPFSVDTWSPSSKRKRYHFLTHAHKDHCSQINLHASFPIYATHLTKALILQYFPQLHPSLFLEIEVGRPILIDDPDSPFSVTAFDANHCPGAVMFLFEGDFGNVLHTGDCRLTAECLQNLPLKYITKKQRDTKGNLDYLFLDCTFGSCSLKIPSKHSAIQQVINCIWKHPQAPVVYLACGLLGQEEILVEVSRTFGSKIYVDETKNAECYQALALTAPHILSEDISCRFQVLEGFPRLHDKANVILTEAKANLQPEPLFIRPSAQWYACEECSMEGKKQGNLKLKEAEKDQFGVWHVCYSMHSSREELEWALELLHPKWVISTTPTCRAMELNYVRSHCFATKITRDDPLWKLLNISAEKSSSSWAPTISPVSDDGVASSAFAVPIPNSAGCSHLSPKKSFLNLSPPSCKRPITLFGRARLVLDSCLSHEQKTKTRGSLSSLEKDVAKELLFEKPKDDVLGRKRIIRGDSNVYRDENKMVSAKTDFLGNVTCRTTKRSFQEDTDAEGQFKKSRVDREDTNAEEGQFEKPKHVKLGRNRTVLQESNILNEEKKMPFAKTDFLGSSTHTTVERSLFIEECASVEGRFEKKGGDTEVEKSAARNKVSNSFDASIRKLYRSMNVPVPRPLPSLVELMGVGKRTKTYSVRERNLHAVNL